MKIQKSTVEKLLITDTPMPNGFGKLDPIAVMVEDFGPGQGKITITCYGDAWSSYWSHMGEKNKLADFFCGCDKDYLAGKLKVGIREQIDDKDDEALGKLLKREIINRRRQGDISKQQARDWWDDSDWAEWDCSHQLCADVLGDEWWCLTPKKPNPEYERLCQIIEVVKQALKENATP